MRVNNTDIVVNVQAIRISEGKPTAGDLCQYEIRVYNTKVSEVECEYGSAVKLGHIMLDEYDKLSSSLVHQLHVGEVEKSIKHKLPCN